MKLKKTLVYLLLALMAYFGIGVFLLNFEIIQRLYIFPGWSIKHGNTDEDSSTVSADGPIILYQQDQLLRHQIVSDQNELTIEQVEITREDTLTCYIEETKDTFSFLLKDTLKTEVSEFPLPEKMLILSDIEGNFNGLKMILKGNHIINNNFNWTFGVNHLVLIGDFFDRGLNVTECLWLIYKLEREAEAAGGKVHFLLGNHEMMNLKGQLKYVRDKYIENADTLKLPYGHWFGQNSELGRWLRTKNAIEKIGKYLFVHAGISKDFPKGYSLETINDTTRKLIDMDLTMDAQGKDVFIGKESPLWYRGIGMREETQEDIEETLSAYKVEKMIIGHTIAEAISYSYNRKVILIDLAHASHSATGTMAAL